MAGRETPQPVYMTDTDGDSMTDATGHLRVAADYGKATYAAVADGYAAYATPTDMVGIRGSATKTVRIMAVRMAIRSTSAAVQVLHFIKRSTANTGGTVTNPTPVAMDSANPVATAVIDVYGAAPTLGAAAGTVKVNALMSTTLTAGFTMHDVYSPFLSPMSLITFHQPVILRGAAESLYINYAGAALTAGFSAYYDFVWTEE